MTSAEFSSAVNIIKSIDEADFDLATGLDEGFWRRFRADPVGTFIRLDERSQRRLWALVEARQPIPAVRRR